MTESTPPPDRPAFSVPRSLALTLLGATVVGIVLAFLIGARNPHVQVQQASCDTTADVIQCYADGEGTPWLVVHPDGLWQDADAVWRRGRPERLSAGDAAAGPVHLGVVEGSDNGMAWKQVVWVARP